jgi:hypothetical protein
MRWGYGGGRWSCNGEEGGGGRVSSTLHGRRTTRGELRRHSPWSCSRRWRRPDSDGRGARTATIGFGPGDGAVGTSEEGGVEVRGGGGEEDGPRGGRGRPRHGRPPLGGSELGSSRCGPGGWGWRRGAAAWCSGQRSGFRQRRSERRRLLLPHARERHATHDSQSGRDTRALSR